MEGISHFGNSDVVLLEQHNLVEVVNGDEPFPA
jgi:hypothetical protein